MEIKAMVLAFLDLLVDLLALVGVDEEVVADMRETLAGFED